MLINAAPECRVLWITIYLVLSFTAGCDSSGRVMVPRPLLVNRYSELSGGSFRGLAGSSPVLFVLVEQVGHLVARVAGPAHQVALAAGPAAGAVEGVGGHVGVGDEDVRDELRAAHGGDSGEQ
jgi:hypothetical protein